VSQHGKLLGRVGLLDIELLTDWFTVSSARRRLSTIAILSGRANALKYAACFLPTSFLLLLEEFFKLSSPPFGLTVFREPY